jgi:hypothetical protein
MDFLTENNENYRKIVIYGILALLSIALLLVGFWLHPISHDQSDQNLVSALGEHFAIELGIAGIVALVLALTIESLSHREFRKLAQSERNAIKKDVFHYVYGHSIPEEIVTEIEVQVLQSLFVKRNQSITHLIERYEPNPKYVLLTTHVTYDLYNLTDKTQTYHLMTFSEAAPEPDLQDQAKYLRIRVDDCEKSFEMDVDQLVASQDRNKIGGHLVIEQDIRILPDKPSRFALSMQTLKSLHDGYDIFLCSDPTCGFDIKVHVSHNLDLEVSAHSFHPENLKVAMEHSPPMQRYHWSMKRPLLMNQGAYVHWRPKRPQTERAGPQAGVPEHAGRKGEIVLDDATSLQRISAEPKAADVTRGFRSVKETER